MLISGTGRRSVHKRILRAVVKPSFSLSLVSSLFPSSSFGDGTPTFTRATTAYVLGYGPTAVLGVDSPILLLCNAGEARFMGARRISANNWSAVDANGVALTTTNGASSLCCDASGPLGYLAEGLRTNTALHSETLSGWGTVGLAATDNIYVAPNGATSMSRMAAAAGNTQHYVGIGDATTATGTHTESAYVRYVNNQWFVMQMVGSAAVIGSFDLLNGVVGATIGGATSTITPTGITGVYRITLTGTPGAAAGTATVSFGLNTSDSASLQTWNAAGTELAGVFGWQIEAAAFASSYIPTTTTALARNASIDQYVSAGNLNATAMTLALDWTPEAAAMGTVFMFGTYVDASNYTALLHDGTNMIARKRIGGTNHDATKALSYAANTTYRIVGRFDSTNGVDVWVAGVKGTGDATTTASQVGTNFQVGADGNSLQQAFGAIRRFAVDPKGLTDSQAAAL